MQPKADEQVFYSEGQSSYWKSAPLSNQAVKREPRHPKQTEAKAEGREGRAEPGRGKVTQGDMFVFLQDFRDSDT